MLTLLELAYFWLGLFTFFSGLHVLLYFPLALVYMFRRRWTAASLDVEPLVSVVVPAYNEGAVIANCVGSILNSDYENLEVILVNDGSTDHTLTEMQKFAGHPAVQIIDKPNGGKASALNEGIKHAKGDIIFFVDADGIFRKDTIHEMLRGFHSPEVGAVCGNDSPVNLDRLQTRLLAIQTHVTTGLARRALATMNCLLIVSGNIGAFRRTVIEKIGGFRHGFIGEDLELTWRVHQAGYKVEFQPNAMVYAEVPSTIASLWKQRVRWARGLLQTAALHRRMFFNPRYRLMGLYLPLNLFSHVVVPLLQLLTLGTLVFLFILGGAAGNFDMLALLGWLGFGTLLLRTVFAVLLDGAWRDLSYFYVLPLSIPYSIFLNVVSIWALILELRRTEAKWNKFSRTGVVSRQDVAL
ncbi:MAG: glycosyltransferase family 2 protein [Anaerolineales bacterium]